MSIGEIECQKQVTENTCNTKGNVELQISGAGKIDRLFLIAISRDINLGRILGTFFGALYRHVAIKHFAKKLDATALLGEAQTIVELTILHGEGRSSVDRLANKAKQYRKYEHCDEDNSDAR